MAKHMAKQKIGMGKIVLLVLSVLLLVVGAVFLGVVNHYLNKINRPDPNQEYMNESEYVSMVLEEEKEAPPRDDIVVLEPEDVTLEGNDTLLELKGDVTNILLIGQDRREGEGRTRSDSIILCSINKTSNKITLVSFLRDLYVQIPGYQDTRINAAYAYGGAELLNETLELNFGIEIDANVEIDFYSFQSVIDAMGGVYITLSDAEYQYFQDCGRTHIVPGGNYMNGEDALLYASLREIDSDFGRTNRQRNVLESLFSQIRGADVGRLIDIANALLPMLTVDMSNAEIIGYVMEFAPMLGSCSLETYSIPGGSDYYDAVIRDMQVLVPDLPACREKLQQYLSAE